ncbi:DUF58 domain-containing protein [Actinokineospora soli]|uniref:DUF58 domain-containing protein n=1 Tax=Actinokineospora soli TaxID=1048753 RepID=A0ABW2TJF6_9PSEU
MGRGRRRPSRPPRGEPGRAADQRPRHRSGGPPDRPARRRARAAGPAAAARRRAGRRAPLPAPGEGTEHRSVRPFQPGDRVRRVDWRVTLRAGASTGLPLGSLHVRERHAEADADLLLAIDSRVDVGSDVGEWSTPAEGVAVRPGGSLDTAVRTAVALAAGYLRQGDRVGLIDLGRPQLGVPRASAEGTSCASGTSSSPARGPRAGRPARCCAPSRRRRARSSSP